MESDQALPDEGSTWEHPTAKARIVVEATQDKIRWKHKGGRIKSTSPRGWARWVATGAVLRDEALDTLSPGSADSRSLTFSDQYIDLGHRCSPLIGIVARVDGGAPPDETKRTVAECLGRGVSQAQIAEAMGLTLAQVRGYVAKIKANYEALTPGLTNLRREQCYQRALELYRIAIGNLQNVDPETPLKDIAALVKAGVGANGQALAALGVREGAGVNVQIVNHAGPAQSPRDRVVEIYGIDPSELGDLGDQAAQALTDKAKAQG